MDKLHFDCYTLEEYIRILLLIGCREISECWRCVINPERLNKFVSKESHITYGCLNI